MTVEPWSIADEQSGSEDEESADGMEAGSDLESSEEEEEEEEEKDDGEEKSKPVSGPKSILKQKVMYERPKSKEEIAKSLEVSKYNLPHFTLIG